MTFMKAVILAGGLGTRLSEETVLKPKPMVEIGGRPILWHIMKSYSQFGVRDFVICLGYKGYIIKEYFANYGMHMSDITVDTRTGEIAVHRNQAEDWRISLIDTGEETMTGGRLKRALSFIDDQTFCLTYGDGVSDVDIGATIDFHKGHGRKATVTAVRPLSRFGQLFFDGTAVTDFAEKPLEEGGWINGGFFVLDRSVGDYLEGDDTIWERAPMERLASDGEMQAYFHNGFWQPMDTLRDRQHLEALWAGRQAPWKTWL
jgi:glucose-1-phosphate cytidylyltransferase